MPWMATKVASAGVRLEERVEGREGRAQQRRGLGRRQLVRDRDQAACPGLGDFRVAAVDGHPGHRLVGARDEVAPPAELADSAVTAEEPEADPLPCRPSFHAGSEGVDHADDLVPGNPERLCGLHAEAVGVADPAGFDPDPGLSGGRVRPAGVLLAAANRRG